MFIKQIKKKNAPTGKTFCQYQLTQSARINGTPKHISLLYMGSNPLLAEKTNRDIVASILKSRILGQYRLDIKDFPAHLVKLADQYYQQYLVKNPDGKPRSKRKGIPYNAIYLDVAQLENIREIGCEWMLVQMANRLGLSEALKQQGWNRKQINTALCSIISKAIIASSEHKTAQWLSINSGLCTLLGYKAGETPSRHHLYQTADALYQHKNYLENYLYEKTLNIFNLLGQPNDLRPDQHVL